MLQVWKGHFKSSYKSKKGQKHIGKLKDTRISKPAEVHELSAQAAVGPWTWQQCAALYKQTAYYNQSPQSEIYEAAFHHMQTV